MVAGLERDVRGWAMRYRNLERDKEREARDNPLWDEARKLFDYWRRKCHHSKARFDAERFRLLEPYLKKDGATICRRAIDGAAFDSFTTRRRNGKPNVHNKLELIFRDRGRFDDFVDRAPYLPEPGELLERAQLVLEEMPEDERPTEDRIRDAVAMAKRELEEARR